MVKGEWNLIFFHYVRKKVNEFLTSKRLLHLTFLPVYVFKDRKFPLSIIPKVFSCCIIHYLLDNKILGGKKEELIKYLTNPE